MKLILTPKHLVKGKVEQLSDDTWEVYRGKTITISYSWEDRGDCVDAGEYSIQWEVWDELIPVKVNHLKLHKENERGGISVKEVYDWDMGTAFYAYLDSILNEREAYEWHGDEARWRIWGFVRWWRFKLNVKQEKPTISTHKPSLK